LNQLLLKNEQGGVSESLYQLVVEKRNKTLIKLKKMSPSILTWTIKNRKKTKVKVLQMNSHLMRMRTITRRLCPRRRRTRRSKKTK